MHNASELVQIYRHDAFCTAVCAHDVQEKLGRKVSPGGREGVKGGAGSKRSLAKFTFAYPFILREGSLLEVG